jgi:hypothetical protein
LGFLGPARLRSFTEHYFDDFVWTVVLIYAHMIVVTMLLMLCTVLVLETLQTDITAMLVAVNNYGGHRRAVLL